MVPQRSLFISLFVIAIYHLNTRYTRADIITPNAWGIARDKARLEAQAAAGNGNCVQPEPTNCICDEDLSAIYYKKLVNYLFRKSKQVVDDLDGKHLISIHLQITEKQLIQLKESDSVRDIDSIVSTVIANSKNDFLQEAKEKLWSWFDQLHYFYLCVINSQMLMLLCHFAMFLLSVIIMHRLLNINIIPLILIIGIFVSFFFEYLECNRKLEYSNLAKLKSIGDSNPCEQSTSFFGLRSGYDSNKCADYMMSIHGHNRQFCHLPDVFSEFILKLFYKPFSMLLDKIAEFMEKKYDELGLWKAIPIIIAILILLVYWMRALMKGFFQVLVMGMFNRQPRQRAEQERVLNENKQSQPSVVHVVNHITIDPKAIGDYVQTLRNDEERSRGAITSAVGGSTDGSPTKAIEDVSNGSEINSSLEDDVKKEQ